MSSGIATLTSTTTASADRFPVAMGVPCAPHSRPNTPRTYSGVTAGVMANLNATLGSLVDAANTQIATATEQQTTIYRSITTAVDVLYKVANTTAGYVSRAIELEGEVGWARRWQQHEPRKGPEY